ncbi:GmrSD restriction endonuclease domain-containing protein [Dyella sp.]|uniref:GmrSD restriction endonuclease domain-containing protein n=1 Tax=Dyella sp. TaxID=1869338 RepID=UPI003F7E3CCF
MLADINNADADGGGLWLPNIQRLFVWDEEQIAKLFDSIMRQYPLSSMLVWKTREPVRRRKFIEQHYAHNKNLKSLYQSDGTKRVTKRLVLDGQQRLQSLYLGLKGGVEGCTLHFNLLSGVGESVEESKFHFAFRSPKAGAWPWVQFSDLIYTKRITEELVPELLAATDVELTDDQRRTATRNIGRAKREFEIAEAIVYQEIDGTDEDNQYSFEDVVEIFIRANSGGTKLSKSDLMFTLLTTQWDVADTEMEEFLVELNDNRFEFTRDFVIKTAMSLLGYGAKYDVDKLYKESVRKNIADNWKKITQAISFVRDQMVDKTFLRSSKALTSQNALIPLIYFRYHFPEAWGQGRFLKTYLLKVLLAGAFSGRPDGLIDKLVTAIKKAEEFDTKKIFALIEADGRNLDISADTLFDNMGYGSGHIHILFNIWYDTNYRPAYNGHLPQVDHIFARALLQVEKVPSTKSSRLVQKYSSWEINQLANCMLLTAKENGAGDKSDTPLDKWLKDKDDDFFSLHCIPTKKSLWKIENYEAFIEARQELIRERFADLLQDDE